MHIFLLICVLFCVCNGFLLDDKTQPPTSSVTLLTEEHYKFVMQFVIQERQSRVQLEEHTKQLKQELVTTKTELTTELNNLKQCGFAPDLKNNTDSIQKEFDTLKSDYNALKAKNNETSQRALLSVITKRGTTTDGNIFPFKSVVVSDGISDLSSINNSGIFTCENDGFYLVSFFISFNSHGGFAQLYQNADMAARVTIGDGYNTKTQSLCIILKLKIGDTLSVKALHGDVYTWGFLDCILSFLQVK
ncbi:unnamed protein product [Mytilus edulis]|uniref:C1q domain-containing protein n=1 Tax=Mytilus edulis TaxID=6550 RepID=A0A8S3U975_MYTED|nr:unnamed protein product [Mytilus edulis]